jgi:chromate transport protein ChrA
MTIAAAVLALPDAPWVGGALTGLQVAVVGLLTAALWHLARREAGSAPLLTVLLAGFCGWPIRQRRRRGRGSGCDRCSVQLGRSSMMR